MSSPRKFAKFRGREMKSSAYVVMREFSSFIRYNSQCLAESESFSFANVVSAEAFSQQLSDLLTDRQVEQAPTYCCATCRAQVPTYKFENQPTL